MKTWKVVAISGVVATATVLVGEFLGSRGYLAWLWPSEIRPGRMGVDMEDDETGEGLSESDA